MIRVIDIIFAIVGLVLAFPIIVVLSFVIWFNIGSPVFLQQRVGRFCRPFTLVKLRTMNPNTAWVPTHLADASAISPLGRFLRGSKLDELPQLWNVLMGEMSIVGPRPCLMSQVELIEARRLRGVYNARPGITGLAQIRGIDMSSPKVLAEVDAQMLANLSIKTYFFYILSTLRGSGSGDRARQVEANNRSETD